MTKQMKLINESFQIRQNFTDYQKAGARYYNNTHGRFTAVDPLLASGKSVNPQTFNRYAYTMNRPLILTDSTGLQAGRELAFGARHPVVAREIGPRASELGTNIASVAARYAVNAAFSEKRGLEEPAERNALRHTILSAIITVRHGAEIAQEATDSHESDNVLPSSQSGSFVFKSEMTADKEVDLRNNEVGRDIGEGLSPSASRKEVAIAVLTHFKDVGLVVSKKNEDGTFEVITTKISAETYNNTLNEWSKRDDDALTPDGRRRADEANNRTINDERKRNGFERVQE